MILFNDLGISYQKLKNEIDTSIQKVLNSGWYILGKELERFESEFSSYIGTEYCVGVGSGTDALTLSLLALNIGQDDEVITTNLTAYPTIIGILQSGAKPVLVDIFAEDGLIDYNKIEEKITRKTKAIMPVHLYGQSCNMVKIMQIANKHKLFVVEDCAQSAGTSFEGKMTGTFGQCNAFSFYPTKNLGALGDGGAVVTNNEQIYKRLLLLRNYGQTDRYTHEVRGINTRLDEIQAKVLQIKLKYLDEWNEKRQNVSKYYRDNLTNVDCLTEHSYGLSNCHLFVVKSKFRDKLFDYLKENSIQSFIHYPIPVNLQKAFTTQKNQVFEISPVFANEILSLPIYPEIDKTDLNYIIKKINEFKWQ